MLEILFIRFQLYLCCTSFLSVRKNTSVHSSECVTAPLFILNNDQMSPYSDKILRKFNIAANSFIIMSR